MQSCKLQIGDHLKFRVIPWIVDVYIYIILHRCIEPLAKQLNTTCGVQ